MLAVVLVGSHARGTAADGSDVDVVILTDERYVYLDDHSWLEAFGGADEIRIEDRGEVQSVRAFLRDGPEVEFGFACRTWAELPLDEGTEDVVANGIRVLYDPYEWTAKMCAAVNKGRPVGEAYL